MKKKEMNQRHRALIAKEAYQRAKKIESIDTAEELMRVYHREFDALSEQLEDEQLEHNVLDPDAGWTLTSISMSIIPSLSSRHKVTVSIELELGEYGDEARIANPKEAYWHVAAIRDTLDKMVSNTNPLKLLKK